jgi:hypothetical protein
MYKRKSKERLSIMKEKVETVRFIVTDIEDDFYTKWYGKMIDAKPVIKNNKFIFTIVSGRCRLELNTIDINYVEKMAKKATSPKGRQAVTSDSARIYIQEESGNEMLLGVVFHTRTKSFVPIKPKKRK